MKKMKYTIFFIISMVITVMLAGCDEIEEDDVALYDVTVDDVANSSKITFSTTDIDGNDVSIEDFSDSKLIMINFWEPWCGPCVKEMPDLEELYEEYKEDGFVILGVFSTDDMDDEVRDVLDSCGTTYPILRYSDEMKTYITDYVPTTIFVDSQGNVLTDEPIIGGNSYDSWKQVIEEYMQ